MTSALERTRRHRHAYDNADNVYAEFCETLTNGGSHALANTTLHLTRDFSSRGFLGKHRCRSNTVLTPKSAQ